MIEFEEYCFTYKCSSCGEMIECSSYEMIELGAYCFIVKYLSCGIIIWEHIDLHISVLVLE